MSSRFDSGNKSTYDTWQRALTDGVLLGKACPECNHVTAAPKAACVRYGHRETYIVELPTVGTVYAETTVYVPPTAFEDRSPYGVSLVQVGNARLMAHLEGDAEIGDRVKLDGAIKADGSYGPLFIPVSAPD